MEFKIWSRIIVVTLILITALAGTITYRYYANTKDRPLLILVWVPVLVELINYNAVFNYYYADHYFFQGMRMVMPEWFYVNNFWITNLYFNFLALFFLYYFYRYLNSIVIKKVFKAIGAILVCIFIYNYMTTDTFNDEHQALSLIAGNLLILFTVISFLFDYFLFEQQGGLVKLPVFWVAIGALFFFVGNTPNLLLINVLGSMDFTYSFFLFVFNILWYSSLLVCFYLLAFRTDKKLSVS
ncbi:hypothetical protein [Robertkochia aurantiaca]|uniref:hypothetical protein n=1 Tax=Robertkochia aurantiaca TaxID=2873700 RepID=UPI001CCCFC2F|nr:hypothetical protein [Robertkochia sp. 3YJGBD-33]